MRTSRALVTVGWRKRRGEPSKKLFPEFCTLPKFRKEFLLAVNIAAVADKSL